MMVYKKLNGREIWVGIKTIHNPAAWDEMGINSLLTINEVVNSERTVYTSTSKAGLAEVLGVSAREIEHGKWIGDKYDGSWNAVAYRTELIAKKRGV